MTKTVTVQCDHCETDLQVTERTIRVSEEHCNGSIICDDCKGRQPYPGDVPECDIADCEMPAPFSITTAGDSDDIHRCREDLRRELTGESWNDWRFYHDDDGDEEREIE